MNNFEQSPTRTQPNDSDYISPIVDSLHNFGKEKIKQLINYGAEKIKNEAKKELPTSVVTNFDKIYYAIGGSSGVAVFLFVCLIGYYAYKKIRIHLRTRTRNYRESDGISNLTNSNIQDGSVNHVQSSSSEGSHCWVDARGDENDSDYSLPASPVSLSDTNIARTSQSSQSANIRENEMSDTVIDSKATPNNDNSKIRCYYCEKSFTSRGMPRHVKSAHYNEYELLMDTIQNKKTTSF